MTIGRRAFLARTGAAMIAPLAWLHVQTSTTKGTTMYGLIGKMTVVTGQRDALAEILLGGRDARLFELHRCG